MLFFYSVMKCRNFLWVGGIFLARRLFRVQGVDLACVSAHSTVVNGLHLFILTVGHLKNGCIFSDKEKCNMFIIKMRYRKMRFCHFRSGNFDVKDTMMVYNKVTTATCQKKIDRG